MLASCEGYNKDGREVKKYIDNFVDNEIIKKIHITEVPDTPDYIFYSTPKADDEYFNLAYFERPDNTVVIILTAGTIYLMDNNGKTFEIIRTPKRG